MTKLCEKNNCVALNISPYLTYESHLNLDVFEYHLGVSKNMGIPKWMVYNGKPYEQMDDLGDFPIVFGSTPI